MKSSALARLESLLQTRNLAGSLARPDPDGLRLVSSGHPGIDAALGGGWRRGEVSELVGLRSSGRTSVLVATIADVRRRGELVGLVDALDRFDPWTAAAAGVDFAGVLWVRGPALAVEMAQARPALLERAVHQALRALDLLMRAGGFGLVVLDVGDVPARVLRALPWTTWLRLARANEGRETVCLLVGEGTMGRSARGASIQLTAASRWAGASVQSRRLIGLDIRGHDRRATIRRTRE
jgi:recombination protein RecA